MKPVEIQQAQRAEIRRERGGRWKNATAGRTGREEADQDAGSLSWGPG